MRKSICWCACIVACMMFLVLIAACGQQSNNRNSNERNRNEWYSQEDFQSIVIGESTYRDVYNIAPLTSMQVTSYGGFCEYPMQDGGCVRIKFYSQKLIVGMIEVDSSKLS